MEIKFNPMNPEECKLLAALFDESDSLAVPKKAKAQAKTKTKTTQATKTAVEVPETPETPEPTETPAPGITMDQLIARVREDFISQGKQSAVVDMLARVGCKKVSEIPENLIQKAWDSLPA